jgi:hypothetical protein
MMTATTVGRRRNNMCPHDESFWAIKVIGLHAELRVYQYKLNMLFNYLIAYCRWPVHPTHFDFSFPRLFTSPALQAIHWRPVELSYGSRSKPEP